MRTKGIDNKTAARGRRAEDLALSFLEKKGMVLLERNYRCRFGEIDIIMAHRDYLIFVEVRFRSNPNFGGAFASVDFRKQAKLRKTAEYYLQTHNKPDTACRFDIISLTENLESPKIDWLENAF